MYKPKAAAHPRAIFAVVFALLLIIGVVVPACAGPDLDVAYISRTPRYQKYQLVEDPAHDKWDEGIAVLRPAKGQATVQRWPKAGELVTFTAVVKNPGDTPTGEFSFKWYMDGVEVKSGKLRSIAPGSQVTTTYQWKWDSEWYDHNIKFVADPSNDIKETLETNNSREDRTNALSFRLHIWKSVYDWFQSDATKMNPNIAGFDDWAQSQMTAINDMFKNSVYPTSPQGILERVRLDEIVVEPNDAPDPDPGACHAPADLEWDCRWGFYTNEYPKLFTDDVPQFITEPYIWIMHEWGHQMGKIDSYQMDISKDHNNIQPYGHLVTPSYDLMTTTVNQMGFSEMHASVFNYDLHKRRGYFGEYMYDLPKTCKVRVLDAYGNPIPKAEIKFFEDHVQQVNYPEDFTGTTDDNGVFEMPNRPIGKQEVTLTGHVMHDNPWGLMHLAGFNSLFFCDIKADGQTDYQYVEIFPFNMAYRAGSKDSYTYDIRTTIVPGGRITNNSLFGVKMISKTRGYAVGTAGTILVWDGNVWTQVPPITGQSLVSIDADPSGETFCTVGGGGTVLVGWKAEWNKKSLGPNTSYNRLTAVAVPTPTLIIAGGDGGQLFRSTDRGETWQTISGIDSTIKSIRFSTPGKGVMVCEGGAAYYTTDGGVTWTKTSSEFKYTPFTGWKKGGPQSVAALTDCCMPSDTEAWACSDTGIIFKSTDGGVNWNLYSDLGKATNLFAIDVKTDNSGWTAGMFNKYYDNVPIRRLHWGKWSTEAVAPQGNNDFVYDISCISADECWLVGKAGLLLHLQSKDWPTVQPNRPTDK